MKPAIFLSALACVVFPLLGSAQTESLLDVAALDSAKVYRNLEQALLEADSVYCLELLSDNAAYYSRLRNPSVERMPDLLLPENLANLRKLQRLTINYHWLNYGQVPASLGYLPNLQELNIRGNAIQSLPAELGNLEHLSMLDLSANNLAQLPADIGRLSGLTALDLSRNYLVALPVSVGNLTNLTSLNLNYNMGMGFVPGQVGELVNLTELNLSTCGLYEVPSSLNKLANLVSLDLSGNLLSALPDGLGRLGKLENLNLRGNMLTVLPADFSTLSATLKELDLRGNLIAKADAARIRQLFPNTKVRI